MTLETGTKLGPYEIVAPLDAGLMECGRVSCRRGFKPAGRSAAALQSLRQDYIVLTLCVAHGQHDGRFESEVEYGLTRDIDLLAVG